MTVFIEEMKQVDGVMVPSKVRTKLPSFEMIMTVTEIKSGPVIDDAKFARPKAEFSGGDCLSAKANLAPKVQ